MNRRKDTKKPAVKFFGAADAPAFFSAGVWRGMNYSARMELFNKILKIAVDGGASDIHIKIGTPVIFRINRELVAVDCPLPTADWMNRVVEGITPVHLKQKLEADREVDFSYFVQEFFSLVVILI